MMMSLLLASTVSRSGLRQLEGELRVANGYLMVDNGWLS